MVGAMEAASAGVAHIPAVALPPPSPEELSARFAKELLLAFGDCLPDGFFFAAPREAPVLFNAGADAELSQTVVSARNLLRM